MKTKYHIPGSLQITGPGVGTPWKGLGHLFCSECDGNLVKSDQPDSGAFYSTFGAQWVPPTWERPGYLYPQEKQVIFALCTDCLPAEKE